MSQNDFDVSDDDNEDNVNVMTVSSNVAPSMNMTPVSDLAFVAALAQAELDVINGTHEDNDNGLRFKYTTNYILQRFQAAAGRISYANVVQTPTTQALRGCVSPRPFGHGNTKTHRLCMVLWQVAGVI